MSKNPQTGKNNLSIWGILQSLIRICNRIVYRSQSAEKACTASVFALLHNLPATVSTYADACKLLVFGASLTSVSLSKNAFFDRLKKSLPDGRDFSAKGIKRREVEKENLRRKTVAHGFHRLSVIIINAAFERQMSQMKTKCNENVNRTWRTG